MCVIALLCAFCIYKLNLRNPAEAESSISLNTIPAAHPSLAALTTRDITCSNPYVIDGDTIDCGGIRIRLSSIDAPEMPGHCRPGRTCTSGDPYAAKDYLESLSRGAVVCHPVDIDVYGRTVARCETKGRDLSCAMIQSGHAVRRYRNISC